MGYFPLTSKMYLTAIEQKYDQRTFFSHKKEPGSSTCKMLYYNHLYANTLRCPSPSASIRDVSKSAQGVAFRISLDVGRCKHRRKSYLRLSVSVTQAWLLRAQESTVWGDMDPYGQHPEVCASNSSSLTVIRSLDLCK